LKHSRGSHLIEETQRIHVVQDALGHKNIASTSALAGSDPHLLSKTDPGGCSRFFEDRRLHSGQWFSQGPRIQRVSVWSACRRKRSVRSIGV